MRVEAVTERDLLSWLGSSRGWAAEVGASDGETESPTYFLEKRGWTVLCVEPIPELAKQAVTRRKLVAQCACGEWAADYVAFTVCNEEHGWHMQAGSGLTVFEDKLNEIGWAPRSKKEIRVSVRALDELLHDRAFPRLDFLSIDTEGTEDAVLRGANLKKWMPRVICVENWPNDNKTDAILLPLGYKHVARDDRYTDWYVL